MRIRYLFPLLLLALLSGCSGGDGTDKGAGRPEPEDWPVFRGYRNLSGVARGTLPAALRLRWTRETGAGIVSSPVVGLGRVFIGSKDGKVYSLDLLSGNVRWTFDTKDDIEAPPLLLDGTVYIGNLSGELFALDALTGRAKWSAKTGSNIMGSANWVEASPGGGKCILVGSYDAKMYCFDAGTGAPKWTYETGYYINGAPATDGRVVVFGGCDQVLHIVSARDGRMLGKVNAGSYIAGSAALVDNRAYVGNYGGRLACIDISRKKVVWEYGDRDTRGGFFSSPAVAGDRVYIGSRDRFLHCVDRETGKPVWKFRTRDDVDSSPVVVKDKIVFGSADGRLYLVDRGKGTEVWSYEIGSPIPGSPAVAGGMVVIGAEDGRVYAFGGGE